MSCTVKITHAIGEGIDTSHLFLRAHLFRIIERLFFSAVIIGTGFAAEAPYVIERLVAIPACSLWFQCIHADRLLSVRLFGRSDSIADVICIIHDSTTENKLPELPDRSQGEATVTNPARIQQKPCGHFASVLLLRPYLA